MLSTFAALVALAGMAAMGVSLLRRTLPFLDPLECVAYGAPAGVVVASLALLAAACLVGMSPALVFAVALGSVAVAVAASWGDVVRLRWKGVSLAALVVLGGLTARWALLERTALTVDGVGLWAGHVNVWGDWAEHLGDVSSFAYGDNFPPTHPRLAGLPFAYHYLTSITAAAMVTLGMDPVAALPLQSFVFSVLVALGVYAFARRITASKGAASLAVALFLVGGGLGWSLTLGSALRSHDVWGALLAHPWDQEAQRAANFRWLNVYFSLVYPQRSFLYGLPLGLLAATALLEGVSLRGTARAFVAAGVVAGLLPFAHLGTFLALALVTPFLFLLFPSRRWLAFFGVWIAIAVPQLWVQQGGGPGAAGAIRLAPGWVAAPDPWLWFWLKNLGAFLPLLVIALTDRRLLRPVAERFLWAFQPAFVIANLVAFQPWAWDNSKVLAWWFLSASILGAGAVAGMWREHGAAVRAFLVVIVATMLLSGVLENLGQMLGLDRHLLLTREEMTVAEQVRTRTPPHAVFVAGLKHNHPVPVLGGRKVVAAYPGWSWSQGADTEQREKDIRAILALAPSARTLAAKYGASYVVIGPDEREHLGADLEAYRRTFRSVFRTENYEIFDLDASPTSSSTATAGSGTPDR